MPKIRTLAAAVAFFCQGAADVWGSDFASYGAPCDGVTDAGPAWEAAIAAARAGADKVIRGGACRYVFYRQPSPLPASVTFEGFGPSVTGFECRFSNGVCMNVRGQGTQLRGVYLWTPKGFTGNVGLLIQPRTGQPGGAGYEIVRDVVVTSGDGGQWLVPIYVDGSQNLTAQGAVFGARAVLLDNVRGFNGSYACAILWDAPDLQWPSGNCYQGAGTTDAVYVGGLGPVTIGWRR